MNDEDEKIIKKLKYFRDLILKEDREFVTVFTPPPEIYDSEVWVSLESIKFWIMAWNSYKVKDKVAILHTCNIAYERFLKRKETRKR